MLTHQQQRGFTIIEVVTIISVMGILLGMSVFAFGAWRQRVATTEVRSDLSGVVSAMVNARNFDGGYPTTIPNTFTASDNVMVTYKSGDSTTFCIEAQSTAVPTVVYKVNMATSKDPVAGTCP